MLLPLPTQGRRALQHRHVADEIALVRGGENLFGIVALLESFDFAAQENGQAEIALSSLINQITASYEASLPNGSSRESW